MILSGAFSFGCREISAKEKLQVGKQAGIALEGEC
jgi:hypothetical protein